MTVSELAENSGGEEQQVGGGCRGAGEERLHLSAQLIKPQSKQA